MGVRADERMMVKRGQAGQPDRVRWVLEILEAGPQFSFRKHEDWASIGLTDFHHQGHRPGKDVQNGDHGTEEAPSSSVVHPGVQGGGSDSADW
jgi:hypothetical protein